MKTHRFAVAASVIALLAISVGSSFAQLIGNDFDTNYLWDINPTTGAVSNLRPLGATSVVGVAYQASSGNVYGLTAYVGSPANSLVRIDPTTGATVTIGATGLTRVFEGDLALNPVSGALYGLYSSANGLTSQLFSINVSNGAATILGTIIPRDGDSDFSAMAFDAAGVLYVLGTGLYTTTLYVLSGSGAVTRTVVTSRQLGEIAGMAFDPKTGIAYVADGEGNGAKMLYTLNTTTGFLTPVGSLLPAGAIAGLTFLSAPVAAPEGGNAVVLLACGIMALAIGERYRRTNLNR